MYSILDLMELVMAYTPNRGAPPLGTVPGGTVVPVGPAPYGSGYESWLGLGLGLGFHGVEIERVLF